MKKDEDEIEDEIDGGEDEIDEWEDIDEWDDDGDDDWDDDEEDEEDDEEDEEDYWGSGSKFLNPKYKNLKPYTPGEYAKVEKIKKWVYEETHYIKRGIQIDIDKLMEKIDDADFLSLDMDGETMQLFKDAYAEIITYTQKLTDALSKIEDVAKKLGK